MRKYPNGVFVAEASVSEIKVNLVLNVFEKSSADPTKQEIKQKCTTKTVITEHDEHQHVERQHKA